MLEKQRHNLIIRELEQHESVSVQRLMELTHVSRSTLRRDIDHLERLKKLTRIHGGVIRCLPPSQISDEKKETLAEKKRIALAAKELLNPGETILLGGGSTILEFALLLTDITPLYVATHDIRTACALADFDNLDLTVMGGNLLKGHYSLHGYFTEYTINRIHADRAFIGIGAVNLQCGYMSLSSIEMQTAQSLLQAANQKIILCDHSKFDGTGLASICQLHEIDLFITGTEADPAQLEQLRNAGVEILTV